MRRNEWIYATDKQVAFLKLLCNKCFAKRIETGLGTPDWSRVLKRDASTWITQLLAKLENAKQ